MIDPERSKDIVLELHPTPNGFLFQPGDLINAIKDLDARPKRRDYHIEPAGDYIQVLPGRPNCCTYAYLLKDICKLATGYTVQAVVDDPAALILSWDNTRYTLAWQQPNHEREFVAVLRDGIPQPADKPDPWLFKATLKDKNDGRDSLRRIWGNAASDGIRIHYDPRLPASTTKPPYDFNSYLVNGRKNSLTVSVRVKDLIKGIKQAGSINKKSDLQVSLGLKLKLRTKSDDNGTTCVVLDQTNHGYNPPGLDVWFWIDQKFILDALAGFSDEVIIALKGCKAPQLQPVYFTDGTREAVIMPKYCEENNND